MKTFLKTGIILMLIAIVGWLIFQSLNYGTDVGYPIKEVEVEMRQFVQAMESYHTAYKNYPLGKANEILTILRGRNPQQIVFLNVGQANTNSVGEFVDPWKTPYQIAFDSTNFFIIRSAGKNKIFGDEDDFKMSNSDTR